MKYYEDTTTKIFIIYNVRYHLCLLAFAYYLLIQNITSYCSGKEVINNSATNNSLI